MQMCTFCRCTYLRIPWNLHCICKDNMCVIQYVQYVCYTVCVLKLVPDSAFLNMALETLWLWLSPRQNLRTFQRLWIPGWFSPSFIFKAKWSGGGEWWDWGVPTGFQWADSFPVHPFPVLFLLADQPWNAHAVIAFSFPCIRCRTRTSSRWNQRPRAPRLASERVVVGWARLL